MTEKHSNASLVNKVCLSRVRLVHLQYLYKNRKKDETFTVKSVYCVRVCNRWLFHMFLNACRQDTPKCVDWNMPCAENGRRVLIAVLRIAVRGLNLATCSCLLYATCGCWHFRTPYTSACVGVLFVVSWFYV